MPIEVETRNVSGKVTALGTAGSFSLVVDRPVEAGGPGKGVHGGQLLYLAVTGCISNDLFRDAPQFGVALKQVAARVVGDFAGDPAVSGPITYDIEVSGSGGRDSLQRLVEHVERIAEIPNTLRRITEVRLGRVTVEDAQDSAATA